MSVLRSLRRSVAKADGTFEGRKDRLIRLAREEKIRETEEKIRVEGEQEKAE